MRWCEKLTHPTNAALVTHDPTWKVSLSERELEKLQSHLFVELWKYNFTKYFLIFKKLWANLNLNFIGSVKFCASGSIYLYLALHHLDCQKKKAQVYLYFQPNCILPMVHQALDLIYHCSCH